MQRASLASLHKSHNGSHGLVELLSYNPRPLMVRMLFLLLAIPLGGCINIGTTNTPESTPTLLPRSSPSATASPGPQQTVAPVETTGPSPTPLVHEIVEGDTLLSIAIHYGVELADLLLENPGVNPRLLVIGSQLNIPRSGAQGLVPSATPVPIVLSEVACYESSSGVLTCLLAASVSGDLAAEGVVALVTLADGAGNALQTEPAYGPTNLVLPGIPIPLVATFDQFDSGYEFASAITISALRAGNIDLRYADLDLQISSSEIAPDKQSGTVIGSVDVLSQELDLSEGVRLLAIAFGENDVPVGVRTHEIGGGGSSFDFAAKVFSLGPPIERIEVLSEAAYLP